MKFWVSRTSLHDNFIWQQKDRKPFEGAVWEEREENSKYGRWFTEINTLEELIEFLKKYGSEHSQEVIVSFDDDYDDGLGLEIVDDFR